VPDVRRLSALAAVALAVLAVVLLLRRGRRDDATGPVASPTLPPGPDQRADALRRRLAAARAAAPAPGATEEARTDGDAPDEFEAMRRRVHDEARSAAERMRRAGES
jgi:hypothetical protein